MKQPTVYPIYRIGTSPFWAEGVDLLRTLPSDTGALSVRAKRDKPKAPNMGLADAGD